MSTKDKVTALLEFIKGLQSGSKYKVNQWCPDIKIDDLTVMCGVDSTTKNPIIPEELHGDIVVVSRDVRIEDAAFICAKSSLSFNPLSFGNLHALGEYVPASKLFVKELDSQQSAVEVPEVVMYGNSGGIDNHLQNATIIPYSDLSKVVEQMFHDASTYKDGVKTYGLNNPSLRLYAYDDRINKFVWMLRGDIVDGLQITPTQFVKYCYFKDGSDRLMTLNQSIVNRQIAALVKG